MSDNELTATLGGGCFWCLEAVYQRLEGVSSVVSGYAGGHEAAPTYRSVCTGRSGHAEVIQITYDAQRIRYPTLLEVFFSIHDPTQRDRQGHDVGPQYRSIILYHDEQQRREAEAAIDALQEAGAYREPIVTELVPYREFHPAERYHRDYFDSNRSQPYCRIVIAPKLDHLRAHFAGLLTGRSVPY